MTSEEVAHELAAIDKASLGRGAAPGNVSLKAGEGGLPFDSVVLVSRVSAFARRGFGGEPAGTLTRRRMAQVAAGVMLLITPA